MHRLRRCYLFFGIGVLFLIVSLWLGELPVQAQGSCEDDYCVYMPLVTKDFDPTWVWRNVLTPTLTPAPSSYTNPLMVIDRQGRIHLLWDTSDYYEPKFIYHTYLTASGWTSPTAVAQSLGTSSVLFPPVVAPDGALHLLWRNRETTNVPYRTLYAVFRDDVWSNDEEVFRSSYTGSTLQGVVHLDANGSVHATMVDSYVFTGGVYHTQRSVMGWGVAVALDRPTYSGWVWPDQQGGVRYYGNDHETPPNLYYSYWRSGEFLTLNQRGPDPVSVPSSRKTQLDGQNNLHLFWSDPVPIPGGQVTGLYHQCINSALRVTSPVVLTGTETAYSSDTVRAAGFARWTALAWRETSGARVRLAVWDGCKQTDLKIMPFATTDTWSAKAVAISDAPGKVCVLGFSGYPSRYNVVCADLLR